MITRERLNNDERVFTTDSITLRVQELLRQLIEEIAQDSRALASEDGNGEEIILDLSLEGERYLLIRSTPRPAVGQGLSPREHEIARMVAEGYANKTIAAVLDISSWTVGTHLRRIFAKLGVRSRAAMVAKLLEANLFNEPNKSRELIRTREKGKT